MSFRHILVPIDFGECSEAAIELALTMALRFDARVTLLHASWMPPEYYAAYAEGLAFPVEEIDTRAKLALGDAVARAKAQYRRVDGMLVAGLPWEQILAAVKGTGADLIVMGTHGRRGVVRALLGSVAEKVVRTSPVPVLTTGRATAAKAAA